MDPYFPFEEAVDVWARTFAGLGIQYRGATMQLDLCDRPGKYSNGFCHWPQPAWRKVSFRFAHCKDNLFVPANKCTRAEVSDYFEGAGLSTNLRNMMMLRPYTFLWVLYS